MSRQLLGTAEVRDTWHALPLFGGVICLSWRQYSPKGIKKRRKKAMSTAKLGVRHLCFFHLTTSPKTAVEPLGYSLLFCEKGLTNIQKTGPWFSSVHIKQDQAALKLGPNIWFTSESSFATIQVNKTVQFCFQLTWPVIHFCINLPDYLANRVWLWVMSCAVNVKTIDICGGWSYGVSKILSGTNRWKTKLWKL